jgi:hypothetical protein
MKKIMLLVLAFVFAFTVPAMARQAEINLAVHESGAASGTSPFYIETMKGDAFALLDDSASGTSKFILMDRSLIQNPCWSIQVTDATTTGGDSTFDLAYKLINVDPSTANWTAAPLIRIIDNVTVSSGASVYNYYFNPPPGKNLRFYMTSGATPFSNFEAKVVVNDNAKCPTPDPIRLSVESLTLNTSGVSSFTVPVDAQEAWVSLVTGPFRLTDSSVSGTSAVGQKYSDGDTVIFKGYNDISRARIMLDSSASSGVAYVIYYGKP